MSKTCKRCSLDLPLNAFSKDRSKSDGLQRLCKTCDLKKARKYYNENRTKVLSSYKTRITKMTNRYTRVKKKYNLSPFQYDSLIINQESKCAICGLKSITHLSVDHDHNCCGSNNSCGKCVRGLLCNRCNLGLGSFNDDLNRLLKAIDYLMNYKERTK
jgi:hypothetical protein